MRGNRWVLCAAVLSMVLTVQPFRDSDVWWHLAVGRYTLAHGIPAAEPFSFLHAANAWSGPQWLYELFLVRAVDLGGPGLASLVMGALASAALLVAVLAIPSDRRPAGPWLAAALLLSAAVAAQLVGVRGQVISLLGAALVLHVLMRWRAGSARALWVLPPLFAVWANLHGGFVIGLGILLIALVTVRGDAGRAGRRRLLVVTALSAAATLLNPSGVGAWTYLTLTVGNPTLTGLVTEWQPPDFHVTWLRLFELEAILLVIAWALARRRDLLDVVLAGAVFAASLEAQRNVSLFAIVAAPQLARYGADAWTAHRSRLPRIALGARRPPPRWFGAVLLGVAVAGTAAAVAPQLSAASAARFEATHEPRAAADYAAAHLAGRRLYTVDTWGGYLAYRFPTGRVVYLYDETTVFGEAALQQYLDIHNLRESWSRAVRESGIAAAILPDTAREVSALVTVGWAVACRDGESASVVMTPTAATEAPGDALPAIGSAPACH
jgi:hypothetical protein